MCLCVELLWQLFQECRLSLFTVCRNTHLWSFWAVLHVNKTSCRVRFQTFPISGLTKTYEYEIRVLLYFNKVFQGKPQISLCESSTWSLFFSVKEALLSLSVSLRNVNANHWYFKKNLWIMQWSETPKGMLEGKAPHICWLHCWERLKQFIVIILSIGLPED